MEGSLEERLSPFELGLPTGFSVPTGSEEAISSVGRVFVAVDSRELSSSDISALIRMRRACSKTS